MLHGVLSLNSVLLLLALTFLTGPRLELMYISLMVSIRSNLTHVHDFHSIVLLPYLSGIISFICTNRLNHLHLKWSSSRLVIVAKGVLKLPNLFLLIKQKIVSFLRNLAYMTFYKLLIVFSTKVNLLYFLYVTDTSHCLLLLIKQNCFLKYILRSQILMTWVSFLRAFPSRTNLTPHNIHVTH